MAINAYTGLMGSGKTYEVVSSVIVPALASGRRVVTNIAGINADRIADYLESKGGDLAAMGDLICIENDDFLRDDIFPTEKKPDAVVRAGDLVAVDECWRFWGQDNKIPESHIEFFRMHRHYTDPKTSQCCDIALMIQDIGTLNRRLRAVVEMSTRTVKLKSVGMPTAYRIELYEGSRLFKKNKIDTYNKTYRKEVFPLYKSYSAGDGQGQEKPIDKRQNVLNNPRIWFIVVGVLIVAGLSSWQVAKFFRPKKTDSVAVASPAATANPAASPASPVATNLPDIALIPLSDDFRVVGVYGDFPLRFVVLVDSAGRYRYESPSSFSTDGGVYSLVTHGAAVTPWSGAFSGDSSGLRATASTPLLK